MPKKTDKAARQRVANLLPHVVDKAFRNYQDLINRGPAKAEDEEQFQRNEKAFHESCKSAAAHLLMLLKIQDWAEPPLETARQDGEEADETAVLIGGALAREAVKPPIADEGEMA